MSQGLNGVRERARKNKAERFTALLHHVSVDLLRESYYGLKRKAAPCAKQRFRHSVDTNRSGMPEHVALPNRLERWLGPREWTG